jgi:hypothetical protein
LRAIVRLHQAAEPGIPIDLKQPAEPLQMMRRMARLAVLAVDVGSGGMTGSLPGPVVDGVAPKPSCLRA